MKFIFPKNYKYNAKILGFIDYITAVFDLILGLILFGIINIFCNDIATKVYIFIILFIPVILFSIIGTGGENIIQYIVCIYKFIKKRSIYFYKK